ncbi:sulfatase-like hydrolase/transferase [Pontiellaceae bacterium B12219]|nr:sulfatase-like hydrolase/transferase [Pontiellaceae bacterium B12219]
MIKKMIIAASVLCAAAVQAAEQPNILFIFADDWGWGDLSCHGHPYVKTPNIDRLAEEGMDFQRFTVASPVCSPSRTAVMTGHFPGRHNVDGHFATVESNARRNMPDWLSLDAPYLPRMLKEGGYTTAHYGKWHLSNEMITDSPAPGEYGYDHYGAFNCSGSQMPWFEDSMNAIAFMEKSQREDKPFYINVWMHEPHTPHHVLPEYRWRFQGLEDEGDQIYAAILSHADDRVGELLDALDRLGLTENTLVVFSSDNGPAGASDELTLSYDPATGAGFGRGASKGITGGRKGYKASLFEGGIGVPFIVRWPGKVPAGKVDEVSLISAVDLLPTFCDVAGVEMPEGYEPDGISVVAVLEGQPAAARQKPLYWKYPSKWPARDSKPDHWASYAVVDQTWKLVTNEDLSYVELYDISNDPYEKTDLKEQQPETVKQLIQLLENWQQTLPAKPEGDVFSAERENLK